MTTAITNALLQSSGLCSRFVPVKALASHPIFASEPEAQVRHRFVRQCGVSLASALSTGDGRPRTFSLICEPSAPIAPGSRIAVEMTWRPSGFPSQLKCTLQIIANDSFVYIHTRAAVAQFLLALALCILVHTTLSNASCMPCEDVLHCVHHRDRNGNCLFFHPCQYCSSRAILDHRLVFLCFETK